MPTRTMRSVTPPPIFTSGSHNGGIVSSISTLTSNRYPYNSTMSELFEDLTTQAIQAKNKQFVLENSLENSRTRESRSLPPEDYPRVVSTTLPSYPSLYATVRRNYRQPQKSNQESTTLR